MPSFTHQDKHRYLKFLPTAIQVVVPRLGISKLFPYRLCDKGDVLAAALRYRDDQLAKRNQTSLLKAIPHINPRAGNSPLAGVWLCVDERGAGQRPKAYFAVLYTNMDGEGRKKTFSLSKFGSYSGAFYAAVRFRIEANNLQLDWSSFAVPYPTVTQYKLIIGVVPDVPMPKAVRGAGAESLGRLASQTLARAMGRRR